MEPFHTIADTPTTYIMIFDYMLEGKTTEKIMIAIDQQYPDDDDRLSQDEIWEAIQQVASNWDECVRYRRERLRTKMQEEFHASDLYQKLIKAKAKNEGVSE